MINFAKIGFFTINNSSLTISGREGYKSIALIVTKSSGDPATINGANVSIGGVQANGIEILAGEAFAFSVGKGDDIDALTITAPINCTVKLAASLSAIDKQSLISTLLKAI